MPLMFFLGPGDGFKRQPCGTFTVDASRLGFRKTWPECFYASGRCFIRGEYERFPTDPEDVIAVWYVSEIGEKVLVINDSHD